MLKIIHRVNTTESLIQIPTKYGVEVDVRAYRNKLVLNHDPFKTGDSLEDYLKHFSHSCIILNIKEAGIEDAALEYMRKYKIKKYFLLDVEFPYLYKAARQGIKNIAVRFSEDEPIQQALRYKNLVDWVWIDCNTRLPLTSSSVEKLKGFKTCLVSPERWGRPNDIVKYQDKMNKLNFQPDAIMTEYAYIKLW